MSRAKERGKIRGQTAAQAIKRKPSKRKILERGRTGSASHGHLARLEHREGRVFPEKEVRKFP